MAVLLLSVTPVLVVCLTATTLLRGRIARRPTPREFADMLLLALADRDPDLGAHSCDVARAATIAAKRLGLSRRCVEQVRLAAELHDVGKIAIPERILAKPAALDPDEWKVMQTHTEVGARILSAMPAMAPVGALVLASHERHDGSGYPHGLRGEEIPVGSRIIAVCDAYDAMTTQRVYNRPVSPHEALARLRDAAGSQFDPTVVGVVCAVIQEVLGSDLARSVESALPEILAPNLTSVPPGTLFA